MVRAFVPEQAGVPHGVVDDVHSAFDLTLLVGVLDAQDHLAAHALGGEVGVERSSQIAHMHIAGGTGRKSGAYMVKFHGRASVFLYSLSGPLPEGNLLVTYL